MRHEEILKSFRDRQKEILDLNQEIEPKKEALIREFKEKAAELENSYRVKVDELTKPLDHAREKYKADLKAFAGITDGEKTNVLDVVELILRMQA